MDDTTRTSTGPPVPTKFPMRRVEGLPLEEQRTFAGAFSVARPREDVQPSRVTSLLARRLEETEFTDMVMWLDYQMPPDKAGIVVAFTSQGAFAPHLLELIEVVEIGGQRYRRLPEWDGRRGSYKDGRHDVYLVVEVLSTVPRPPFMTRDVRFVFRSAS